MPTPRMTTRTQSRTGTVYLRLYQAASTTHTKGMMRSLDICKEQDTARIRGEGTGLSLAEGVPRRCTNARAR